MSHESLHTYSLCLGLNIFISKTDIQLSIQNVTNNGIRMKATAYLVHLCFDVKELMKSHKTTESGQTEISVCPLLLICLNTALLSFTKLNLFN